MHDQLPLDRSRTLRGISEWPQAEKKSCAIGGHDFQSKPTASLNQRATYNRDKQTDLSIIDNRDNVSTITIIAGVPDGYGLDEASRRFGRRNRLSRRRIWQGGRGANGGLGGRYWLGPHPMARSNPVERKDAPGAHAHVTRHQRDLMVTNCSLPRW